MAEVFKISVPGDPKYIKVVKMAIGAATAMEGFCIDDVEDIKMAVAEACKIVTCHNFSGWSESYDILWEMDDECFKVTVSDEKCDHLRVKTGVETCMECPREGDISIQVVRSLMDEVKIVPFDRGCKRIVMVKKI